MVFFVADCNHDWRNNYDRVVSGGYPRGGILEWRFRGGSYRR